MGRFIDDEWRQVLEANGFTPAGARDEVWRSAYSDLKVLIGVDPETEEPYYQVITEDGTRTAKWQDTEALKKILEPKEPEPMSSEDAQKYDEQFMKDMKIVGHHRTEQKLAGRPPRFSFAVPLSAAGAVAFHLTKAGMRDFEVAHYKQEDYSMFEFPSEPEMHVAEEIVKAEFADQIAHRKGMWQMWSDVMGSQGMFGGPQQEREGKTRQMVSSLEKEAQQARLEGKFAGQWGDRSYDSDQVHDVLDEHRHDGTEGSNVSFDDALPEGAVPDVLKSIENADDDTYLGVIVWMVAHGDAVPAVNRERARQIAFALVQNEEYLNSWKNPESRRAELEEEIELLEGGKTAAAKKAKFEDVHVDGWYRRNLLG